MFWLKKSFEGWVLDVHEKKSSFWFHPYPVMLGTALGVLLLGFLTLPSLVEHGMLPELPYTKLSTAISLSLIVTLALLRFLDAGFKINTVALCIAIVPVAATFSSVMRVDLGGVVAALVAGTGVVCVGTLPSDVCSRVARVVLTGFVGISCVLSAIDPTFCVQGRDTLPLFVDGRAFGLAAHPNALGLLAFLLVAVSCSRQNVEVTSFSVGVLGLLAAASYTSQIATVAFVSLICAHKLLKSMQTDVSGALLVLIPVAVAFWIFADISGRFFSVFGSMSLTGRTAIWAQLLSIDPGFWGVGRAVLVDQVKRVNDVGSAHNAWIQAFVESGWLGLFSVAMWLLGALAIGCRSRNYALIAGLLATLVLTSTEGVLFAWPHIFTVTLVLSSLGTSQQQVSSASTNVQTCEPSTGKQKRSVSTAPVVRVDIPSTLTQKTKI